MVSCTSLLGTSLGSGSMREVGGDWGADRLAGEGLSEVWFACYCFGKDLSRLRAALRVTEDRGLFSSIWNPYASNKVFKTLDADLIELMPHGCHLTREERGSRGSLDD